MVTKIDVEVQQNLKSVSSSWSDGCVRGVGHSNEAPSTLCLVVGGKSNRMIRTVAILDNGVASIEDVSVGQSASLDKFSLSVRNLHRTPSHFVH